MLVDIWVGDDLYLIENVTGEGETLSLERILAAGIQSLHPAADADRARNAAQACLARLDEERRQYERVQDTILNCREDAAFFEATEGLVHLKQVAAYVNDATAAGEQRPIPLPASVLVDGAIPGTS